MRIKLLTRAAILVVAAFTTLPAIANAEGGPTVQSLWEEPLSPPQALEATNEASNFTFETEANPPYFPTDGFITCTTHELHGTLESNEGPTTLAIDDISIEGEMVPGNSCNTTIESPFGSGTLHARVTSNGESGGWVHELFNGEAGEFGEPMTFTVLFSANIPTLGWTYFAECTYSKTGVETAYEVAPQPFILGIPPQAMEVGGASAKGCPPTEIYGYFTITRGFESLFVTNP